MTDRHPDGSDERRAGAGRPDSGTGDADGDADPEWPVHDTVTVWETPYFTAGYDVVERPTGERARYYWIDPRDAVVVVPVTDSGEVVLVEQYRPRHRTRFLECPAGGLEPDEDAVTAARRELREETGYTATDLQYLGSYLPSGWVRYRRHVVAATGLREGDPAPDDGEYITVRTATPASVLERLHDDPGPDDPPVKGALLTPLLWAQEAGVV